MFPKKKRIVNKELLRSYHTRKCILCAGIAEPHHIKSKGAGGPDEEWNLLALCRVHHTNWHSLGLISFLQQFPEALIELNRLGWVLDKSLSKWRLHHDKLN